MLTQVLRAIGWTIAVLAGLVCLVVVILVLIDWNRFNDEIGGLATDFLGREVSIGELDVDPGLVTKIYLRDVSIANPDWASRDRFLHVDETQLTLEVLPLLGGTWHIPDILLRQPKLSLQRDSEGRVTWEFAALAELASAVIEAEDSRGFPIIDRFVVEQGNIAYLDALTDLDLQGSVAVGAGQAAKKEPLQVELEGRLKGRGLRLEATAGSVFALREGDESYPFNIAVDFGETHVSAEGTVRDPLRLQGLSVDLRLEGPTMADVFPLFNIPLPETRPYSLAGDLTYKDGVWILQQFAGTVGASDLSGHLTLDTTPKIPFLQADLVSQRLNLGDLAPLIGAPPDLETASPEQSGFFPNEPIRAERLHAMNMDVAFEGEQVITRRLPVDRVFFRVRVQDGRAEADPLRFSIAGGRITGEMALNARQTIPSADADLDFDDLDLKPFFKGTEFVQEMGGIFFGHVYVLGIGRSLAEFMSSADGTATVAMQDGTLSSVLVEAAGLDITESLGLMISGDTRVPIRCARMDIEIEDGVADISRMWIDTADSLLVATGFVDLADERLEIQVEARAKDFSLIDINVPVRVWGDFGSLDYAAGGVDPLPFLEMGGQENVDCDQLLGDLLEQE